MHHFTLSDSIMMSKNFEKIFASIFPEKIYYSRTSHDTPTPPQKKKEPALFLASITTYFRKKKEPYNLHCLNYCSHNVFLSKP